MNSSIRISHMKNINLSILAITDIFTKSVLILHCVYTDTPRVDGLYELVSITWHQSRAEPTNTLVATSVFFSALNGI